MKRWGAVLVLIGMLLVWRTGSDAGINLPEAFDVDQVRDLVEQIDGGGSENPSRSAVGEGTAEQWRTALRRLDRLDVRPPASEDGYDRDRFGDPWDDDAGDFSWTGNGCDTRNDVLARDLVKVRYENGSDCEVAAGMLPQEKYTGEKHYRFSAVDDEYDTDLDIDHIVSLGNAWTTGAQQWSPAKRAAFANDPINLLAVDPSSNREKGDASAATWLPPSKVHYKATYVARQVKIKTKYELAVTPAEADEMTRVLEKAIAR